MNAAVRAVALMLLKYGAAILFLHFIGSLPWMASITIAVLIPLDWAKTSRPVKVNFRPHQVSFTPHIGKMLGYLGLITDDDWKAHITKTPEIGARWDCENLMREGVRAVVLSTDPDDEDTVHWIGPNHYTLGLGMRVDLDFLKFDGGMWGWSPSFVIKPGSGGYHMCVRVRDDWWKDNQARVEALGIVKKQDREFHFGTTLLTMEILPANVFWPYYHGWTKESIADATKAAGAFGWKVEEVGNAEVGYFGERYRSDYADVWVSSLNKGY